ncbi:MAG TPA: hypothetical protein VK635_21500, partial [Bradyrhizobium sp.]|nr:hypothetical protein [Bradyrhizobium sp.]
MARAWAFRSPPVTASAAAADAEAKAREYQRFVDDLKIAAEVLRKSARAAWVACPGCCAAHPG